MLWRDSIQYVSNKLLSNSLVSSYYFILNTIIYLLLFKQNLFCRIDVLNNTQTKYIIYILYY